MYGTDAEGGNKVLIEHFVLNFGSSNCRFRARANDPFMSAAKTNNR